VFNGLLALNCGANVFVLFKINKLLQTILLSESAQLTVAMFVATADKVAGDANVKRTVATVGHYVNKTTIHHPKSNKTWMAGTSPAMTRGEADADLKDVDRQAPR
jgi:hypothetical protein